MKAENKIPIEEVFRLARLRCGDPDYPSHLLEDALWSFRRWAHKPTAGKRGYLSRNDTELFLNYFH